MLMDANCVIEGLRELNRLIGIKEDVGDRTFFDALLAPAFAMSRANGVNETRESFLNSLTPARGEKRRKTTVTKAQVLGQMHAAVDCLVEQDGKQFENHRIFIRSSARSPWKLLAWANELVTTGTSPTRLREVPGVYGIGAWLKWRDVEDLEPKDWGDLSDTKHDSGTASLKDALSRPVKNYVELADIVSFLAVMNKNRTLLFRGQTEDFPQLLPTLHRPRSPLAARWAVDGSMDANREWYWNRLSRIEDQVKAVLFDRGLPRWRHIRDSKYARWAVIQHYELWPTPMLDFSTSLRVAASFAFGELDDLKLMKVQERHTPTQKSGFLYITAVDKLQSDLMALLEDDSAERTDGLVTVRLNAVCPPRAVRPHLQDGVLICRYPFDGGELLEPVGNDFTSRLIAKIPVLDDGEFWSGDFPRLTRDALLPTVDELGSALEGAVEVVDG